LEEIERQQLELNLRKKTSAAKCKDGPSETKNQRVSTYDIEIMKRNMTYPHKIAYHS
jgi:hypothetical protein